MPLAFYLMAAGLLPFLAGALSVGFAAIPPAWRDAIEPWFNAYGLVIAAFMAGTLWGRGDPAGVGESRPALAASNVVALALWAAAATLKGLLYDLSLAASFIAMLLAESLLPPELAFPAAYRRARRVATALVVFCLVLHALRRIGAGP